MTKRYPLQHPQAAFYPWPRQNVVSDAVSRDTGGRSSLQRRLPVAHLFPVTGDPKVTDINISNHGDMEPQIFWVHDPDPLVT